MTGQSGQTSDPYGHVDDTTTDPTFKVTSRKPYKNEVVTRSTAWDYFRTSLLMPTQSEVLIALGKNIEEVDQLLSDGRVKACFNNRRSGTLSLKWAIDQNDAPARMYKTIQKVFEMLPVTEIMAECLQASFYGFSVSEVSWQYQGGLWLPEAVSGKAARWFGWADDNTLRYKTKVEQVQGEVLPPRKFLVTRYHPRYDDPSSSREALFNGCYWPVKFRHMIMEYGIRFVEKYGMPWLDVKLEAGLQQERLNEILDVLQKSFADSIVAHPDNTTITPLEVNKTSSIDIYNGWLDTMNREIDMCILGNNMSAEIKGGSYAAAASLAGVRDDIVKEDSRMVEVTMDQLIEWIAWYNWPAADKLPKFRLYKSEPPTKDRAEIDVMLSKLGVKLNKEYFARTYGLNSEEFEIGAPVQDLSTGLKGAVSGAEPSVPVAKVPSQVTKPGQEQMTVTKNDNALSGPDAKTITETGIMAKDVAKNEQTTDAYKRSQAKGGAYSEATLPPFIQPVSKLVFLRHGDTDQNDKHQIRGWSDPPLNAKGLKQATKAAEALKSSGVQVIYSSDLDRALSTAEALQATTGASLVRSKELRPWDVGDYTGMDSEDVLSILGKYCAEPDKQIPGGESFNEFKNRTLPYIQGILAQNVGHPIAVVSHHRVDRLLDAVKTDGSVDMGVFCSRGIEPGEYRAI